LPESGHCADNRGLLDPARQPPGGISSEIPVLSIIQAAGWPVWFLIIASFLALALIIERLISLQRKRVMPESLLEQTLAIHRNRPVSVEMVQKLEAGSPLGRVFATALRHAQSGRESMKEAMEEAGRAVAHDLERYLGALGTIAAVTPLLGLFGTVVGMIEIFGATAPSGTNPQALAHGISVALYNTALGLVVAIPALIAYRAFRTRVDGFLVEMEQQSLKLLDAIEPRRATPAAPAVAPARR
jgi:biopolymer transport protein ExbB